jgi:hypothetical protein
MKKQKWYTASIQMLSIYLHDRSLQHYQPDIRYEHACWKHVSLIVFELQTFYLVQDRVFLKAKSTGVLISL